MGNGGSVGIGGGKSRATLPADGRPFYLYAEPAISGKRLAELLAPLDEAALDRAAGRKVYRVPGNWAGKKAGSAEGNPLVVGAKPLWRLDQVWPDDPMKPGNYRPLPWSGTAWQAAEHSHGGQPAAKATPTAVELVVRTAWPGQPGNKLAALTFIAPEPGTYTLSATVKPRVWDAGAPIALDVLKKSDAVTRVKTIELKPKVGADIAGIRVPLEAGEELVLVPAFPGRGLVAFTCRIEGLKILFAPGAAPGN